MTARASPSILSKGFIWFLSCTQREARGVQRFNSSKVQGFKGAASSYPVVKEEKLSVLEKGNPLVMEIVFCETFPVRGVMYLRNNC